ncbi:cytochrome c-type biogenesis protein [Pelagibacterium xiamenense]|uniref:cytochrome c-type biogenesis protein n=1 Tax=Pelagibacterium xiamenense TaxID=2901140 RepID=UPI001E367ED6|nr:cytochrome c-type biogenesis protein [Pelagibacterium xiamenense]MCD7059514.1 cytochrome c-type biogenesis protein CcmH [Pelagibacterium xiamenense]
MTRWIRAVLLAVVLASPGAAMAVQPDEVLDNPVLETRARSISENLRCLVCQNQSIDDSDAELARDLRVLVRERLVAGDTDQEVYDYVVARYGEFVLLRPVVGVHTILLWIAAPALLLIGLAAVLIGAMRKRRAQTGAAGLSPDEQKALDRLSKS